MKDSQRKAEILTFIGKRNRIHRRAQEIDVAKVTHRRLRRGQAGSGGIDAVKETGARSDGAGDPAVAAAEIEAFAGQGLGREDREESQERTLICGLRFRCAMKPPDMVETVGGVMIDVRHRAGP